jgi:ATP-binding cassette subfamily A (ABC1) protein 3
VLAAPGKLMAEGSPVALKSTLGEGYSVQVTFNTSVEEEKDAVFPPPEILESLRPLAPDVCVTSTTHRQACYHLKSKDSATVEKVLQLLDAEREQFRISTYDVLGTSIEDIFLRLMSVDNASDTVESPPNIPRDGALQLTHARARSPLSQAFTIFHKRVLIARRSWVAPLWMTMIAIMGSAVPLFFMKGRPRDTCVTRYQVPRR